MDSLALIPKSIDDLTAPWLTTVLQDAGHDVEIAAVEAQAIGTGQMASSVRLRIDFKHNRSETSPSVVVKLASQDPNSRAAGARGAYLKEVRFYQQLSADLPLATPQMLWAAIDPETDDFAIVLEDMHPAEQGDQITGCGIDDVRSAALNIAGLHAPTWNDEDLFALEWLTAPRDHRDSSYDELQQILQVATPGFIDRYVGRIPPTQIDLLTWFADTVPDYLADDGGRFSLMHGDHRLDNLLFDPLDPVRPVTVVDWQTISLRNPVADISYLLGTSVEPDVRREIEQDIVAAYHARLGDLGVTEYSVDECFNDYRTQTLHALILTVLGSMLTEQTSRGDDMFMAMLRRSSQQIFDLDVR